MATAAAHFSSNKSNFFWHQSCKWGARKNNLSEIYIYLLQKCTFWACSQKTFEYLFDICRPIALVILIWCKKCRAINVTWSDLFLSKLIFCFLVLTILTQKKSCLWCVIVHKKLVQVFLVLWHDGFWEASTEGGYETTTKSFDGSNKTEVVGGRFFEAAAAVKACENLLGFGLGGLRRQTRVKQN